MSTVNNFLRGTGVALITPFTPAGAVDFPALSAIIDHCIYGGVEYLVSLGTTGETVTLSKEEKRAVLEHTVSICAGRIPIVAGIGGSNTQEICREMQTLDVTGLSAILSSSPAYNKPSQEGIYQHYMQLAAATPLPLIIYNVPGRTASNMLAETTLRLAHASNRFAAIKEASGDLTQACKIIKDRPLGFLVLSGDDPLALALVAMGGEGVISVIANAYPGIFSSMICLALQSNFSDAAQLNLRLSDLHKWLYIDGNPAGIKAAMAKLGLCVNALRLPLVTTSEVTYRKIHEEMDRIGPDQISLPR